jgi:hypothetical protein
VCFDAERLNPCLSSVRAVVVMLLEGVGIDRPPGERQRLASPGTVRPLADPAPELGRVVHSDNKNSNSHENIAV